VKSPILPLRRLPTAGGRSRRTQRQWALNGILAGVLVAAVLAVFALARGGDPASATTAGVRTAVVQTADVTDSVSADGSVEAVDEVAANFDTSGTIAAIKVSVGATVTRGAIIATLDTADLNRALEVAELQLDAAEEQLDAAEEGTTTTDPQTGEETTTVDDAQIASTAASLIQAQATVDDAESAVAAATLKAPIGGTVLQVNGKVGSTTGSGSSSSSGAAATGDGSASSASTSSSDFVVIADLSKLQVSISVPESDIAALEVGQAAAVTFPAVDGIQATGEITSMDPAGTTSNSVVTFGVAVQLTDVPEGIRLGQTASVSVTTATAADAVAVPSTAVTTRGDRSSVTLMADGQQVVTQVELGVVGDTYTQVISGVSLGDEVVLATASPSTGFPDGQFPGGFGGVGGGPPAGFGGGAPGGG
jgi:macrolide-specific efflux system membrane fusion protein